VIEKNNINKKMKRLLKAGAWVAGIVLFLLIGLLFFTTWLQNKVENTVQEQSDGVYTLQLYGLQVSPLIGNVSVDSLSLVPDPKRWQQLHQQEAEVFSSLMGLQARSVALRGLNSFEVLFGKDIQLDVLALSQPKLTVTVMREDTTQQSRPIHESVNTRLQGLRIGEINIQDATVQYVNAASGATTDSLAVANFDFNIEDLRLDSTSFHSKERAFYAKDIKLDAHGLHYRMADGTYKFQSDALSLSTAQKMLSLEKAHMAPLMEPAQMAKSKGHAVTYSDLRLAAVNVQGVDYATLSSLNKLLVHRLEIDGAELTAFKDKKNFGERSPKPLPHDLVQQIQTAFKVDTIEIKRGYARYEELAEEASETGYITLEKLNATLTNVSNMPEHVSMDIPAVAQASGMVMGKAAVNLTVRLPLLHKNGYHTLEGEIGSANPAILNPILAPTVFVSVESGSIASARFNAELNDTHAKGSMQVIYQNLKIDLLSKGEDTEQSFGKKVLTKVANEVVIKSENPENGSEEPRVGEIEVERDMERSVFSYWKDCIMNGFLANMGVAGIVSK
jgi:phenolic acid decarboxylase